jgi:hypothetical protein
VAPEAIDIVEVPEEVEQGDQEEDVVEVHRFGAPVGRSVFVTGRGLTSSL